MEQGANLDSKKKKKFKTSGILGKICQYDRERCDCFIDCHVISQFESGSFFSAKHLYNHSNTFSLSIMKKGAWKCTNGRLLNEENVYESVCVCVHASTLCRQQRK